MAILLKDDWKIPEPEKEEKRYTAEELLALPIGSRVYINGMYLGKPKKTPCTIAGHYNRKFLTYRTAEGMVKLCAIKDYPGKYYTKE